ncbi:MAG: hypothetical protein EAZ91_09075 [Cytophagales bacterium]|nr:MAG: hypothetical protein EAZ91_09075 [Cytophagales bacterium]
MQRDISELENRLLVTARKIRQFNEHIAKLRELGAPANIPPAEQVRDQLEREFQQLSEQVRATQLTA